MAFFNYSYSIPYVMVFFIVFCLSMKFVNTNNRILIKHSELFIVYSLCLIFAVFVGLRGFIYTDWQSYYRAFENTPSLLDSKETRDFFLNKYSFWGKGYLYYLIVSKSIFHNYAIYQLFSFLIDFIILFYFFKEYLVSNQLIVMGFLLFYVFGGVLGFGIEVNLMRNSKSIMFFLISIKYLQQRNFFKFLILNIIGIMFHTTAILFIPLYFVLIKRIPKRIILLFFIIGNIIFLLHIAWLKELLALFNSIITTPLSPLIDVYLRTTKYNGEYGLSIGFLERSFSFVLVYCFEKKIIGLNQKNRIFINSFYLYCFIYLYCSEMSIILDRVGLLFIYSYWILFPQIYALLSPRNKNIYLIAFFLYGLLKCLMCKNVLFYYESFLLPHMDYYTRQNITQAFNRYMGW